MSTGAQQLSCYLSGLQHRLEEVDPPVVVVSGRLVRIVGLVLEAEGFTASIGQRCLIETENGWHLDAEVVGFSGNRIQLMTSGSVRGLSPGARVIPMGRGAEVAVGKALLGRVVDGNGHPVDGKGPLITDAVYPLAGQATNPLQRAPVERPLDVGVRAINALFTLGEGQRLGLVAGSGVGKSVLLGMMARFTLAEVIVVGLIGERGREVKEFIERILGAEGLSRAVVVAAPADVPALQRVRGAMLATTIAEYFRDRGCKVLLLMDSVTRFAMAQRELGLAIGEPPATRGYPPSVFARLTELVERAGNGLVGSGSITAFYTVLLEADEEVDPVGDAARAILDGQIVLSRQLAEAGHYPAINIGASISRVMPLLVSTRHYEAMQHVKQLVSAYRENRDLVNVGAYVGGSDPLVDEALARHRELECFLTQGMDFAVSMEDAGRQLFELFPAMAEDTTRGDADGSA